MPLGQWISRMLGKLKASLARQNQGLLPHASLGGGFFRLPANLRNLSTCSGQWIPRILHESKTSLARHIQGLVPHASLGSVRGQLLGKVKGPFHMPLGRKVDACWQLQGILQLASWAECSSLACQIQRIYSKCLLGGGILPSSATPKNITSLRPLGSQD